MIQFFIKMSAVIAAAYFAVTLPQVGGLSGMVDKLSHVRGPGGLNYLSLLPDFTNNWDLAVAIFIIPLAIQWWSVWYPGAEPGGGSYIAQRMLASKSEKDALGGTLFFNVAHYVLRPWPWILVGLCSLIVYPDLSDIQKAFPNLDPKLLGHDIAYPAMLRFLPTGWIGLMLGGLIAANSSTILTHLNWGASYLVHDFYRRFIKRDAAEHHYVKAGRYTQQCSWHSSSPPPWSSPSIPRRIASTLLLAVGAGTRTALHPARWFWWRINAWCEIVAMIASFAVAFGFLILSKNGVIFGFSQQLIIGVAVTTVSWVAAAYLSPQTDERVLIAFYEKVRPFGPGWRYIQSKSSAAVVEGDNYPLALLGWVMGVTMIWSALFTVGNVLYGRTNYALILGGIFVVSGSIVSSNRQETLEVRNSNGQHNTA